MKGIIFAAVLAFATVPALAQGSGPDLSQLGDDWNSLYNSLATASIASRHTADELKALAQAYQAQKEEMAKERARWKAGCAAPKAGTEAPAAKAAR